MNRKQIATIERINILIDEQSEPQFILVKHTHQKLSALKTNNYSYNFDGVTLENTNFKLNFWKHTIIFKGNYYDCMDFIKTHVCTEFGQKPINEFSAFCN